MLLDISLAGIMEYRDSERAGRDAETLGKLLSQTRSEKKCNCRGDVADFPFNSCP